MPVIVTTTCIFAVNGTHGHLVALLIAWPYAHALELGQVRPRTRLEIKLRLLALRLGQGLGRRGEFACVGTAAPCFTVYNVS